MFSVYNHGVTLSLQVNITYDDYLKSFYPHQKENVFTHNNWTLSDELVEICQSNPFYKQHVRWNIQRFRPCDVENISLDAENATEASQPHVTTPNDSEQGATNNVPQEIPQQQLTTNQGEDEEPTQMSSRSVCAKRKIGLNENFYENPTRTQPRRMKKN
jgi:hypothetical protein